MKNLIFLLTLLILCISGCTEQNVEISERTKIDKAVAVLHPLNDSGVRGIVYFKDNNGMLEAIADVYGLYRGQYGFHIHEYGDINKEDAGGTGVVFDPEKTVNGKWKLGETQPGNLGNLFALNDSLAQKQKEIYALSLNGKNSVLGRSVVIHEGEDDYKSYPCGNAGEIVSVGIIGVASK